MPELPVEIVLRVQSEDFSVADELQAQRERVGGRLGAIASFVGFVRDRIVSTENESEVHGMYLEHYPGMTENSINEIIAKAAGRWPLLDVVVVHRVGELLAKDQIVLVQVASGHRAAAFAACEMIMDYLKTDAVFWKKERVEGAASSAHGWVESTAKDRSRTATWGDSDPDPGSSE